MSFSVSIKHCGSTSLIWLNELRHIPPKPFSSRISLTTLVDSMALAKFGLDDKTWRRACAESTVGVCWQCSKISSSKSDTTGHLLEMLVSRAGKRERQNQLTNAV